ncbi:la-related protein 7 [Halyomorpha halys]|uniref:la-related protein 7 n=1 Tax=Halyomorpha halys TaxID=286706 RepID=UPI0006D4E470|nr:la-related protein 7 [Halyomorpha halys]
MEVENPESENVPKKRGRKKQLYKNILSQMEFYFSASNLAKDRWLSKKLQEENAVPLTEFLRFNKIRALTQDVNDLAKALKNSEIIAVTEDMKVKRTQPIKFKENEDEYIIYIEQIPSDADHEWLSNIFSRYGKIDYVSIPKFKNSNKRKGFAFIEFADVESAKKAVEDYKKNGNYLSTEIEPAELLSISTYEDNKVEKSADSEPNVCETSEALPAASESESTEDTKLLKRRKKSDSSDESLKPQKKKKRKESIKEEIIDEDEATGIESEKDDGNTSIVECDEGNPDESKKKKNRKKKSKKKKNGDTMEHSDLQVLSKKDWKRLRNKYLDMQKEKMKQLKKHIYLARKKAELSKQNGASKKNDNSSQQTETIKEKNEENTEGNSFTQGLIVKVKFNEPAIEVKELKNGLRKNQGAVFVDVKEGDNSMHVRFATPEAALEFCGNSTWPKSKVLKGEKEVTYWNKIQEERKGKLSKNVKKKERGKDKLMRKAENILRKHITFD